MDQKKTTRLCVKAEDVLLNEKGVFEVQLDKCLPQYKLAGGERKVRVSADWDAFIQSAQTGKRTIHIEVDEQNGGASVRNICRADLADWKWDCVTGSRDHTVKTARGTYMVQGAEKGKKFFADFWPEPAIVGKWPKPQQDHLTLDCAKAACVAHSKLRL